MPTVVIGVLCAAHIQDGGKLGASSFEESASNLILGKPNSTLSES